MLMEMLKKPAQIGTKYLMDNKINWKIKLYILHQSLISSISCKILLNQSQEANLLLMYSKINLMKILILKFMIN